MGVEVAAAGTLLLLELVLLPLILLLPLPYYLAIFLLLLTYMEGRKHSPKSIRSRITRRKTLPDSVGLEVAAGTSLLELEHGSWLLGSSSWLRWLDEEGERGFSEDSEELPASDGLLLDLN